MKAPADAGRSTRFGHTLRAFASRWAAVALLLILFAQAALTASHTSLTIDEGLHITSGYTILRTGDYRLIEEHPPLVKLLAALPLLPIPDLADVRKLPGWESDISVLDSVRLVRAAQALIYPYKPIDRIVFAARIPIALLAVLLGAVVFRWAYDLAGWLGGGLALFLLTFDPNILAHASVAGTDLGAACFITLAMFAFWRLIRKPTTARVLFAGVTLGLAQVAKLTGLLLLPIEVLSMALIFMQGKRKAFIGMQISILAIAALTLWAVYDFQIGYVPGVPFPVPAASHAIPWLRLQQHIAGGHAAFLMGQVSNTGWWYYFPITFVLKTPLPALILLVVSMVLAFMSRQWSARQWLTIALFPAFYWVSSMANPLNIGYRHLLPILPFVFVFIGAQVTHRLSRITFHSGPDRLVTSLTGRLGLSPRHLAAVSLCLLLAWQVLGTVQLFPNYLTYFNEAAGGPDGGWRYLADSNTDWGQALKELAAFQHDRGIERVRLSMFTFMDPEIYGVHYQALTPMQGNTPAVFPSRFNPPPGDYVISATTLDGIPLADPEMFDWFRKHAPDDKIGYAMFVYHVKPAPPGKWLAQCSTPVAPLEPQRVAEGFGRSDLRLAYFDCSTSWLYPAGGKFPGWYALARAAKVGSERWLTAARLSYEQKRAGFSPPFLIYASDGHTTATGGPVRIASSETALADARARPTIDLPVTFENGLTLLGYTLDRPSLKPGDTAHLETVWHVDSVPNRLLSIMAHALGPDGRAIAVGDGLGVPIESWQPGDVFIQRHTLTLPKDAPRGTYWIQTGIYWLDDGKRWPAHDTRSGGDRALLIELRVY